LESILQQEQHVKEDKHLKRYIIKRYQKLNKAIKKVVKEINEKK